MGNLFSFTKYLALSHFFTYSLRWTMFFETNFLGWICYHFVFVTVCEGFIFPVNRKGKGASLYRNVDMLAHV